MNNDFLNQFFVFQIVLRDLHQVVNIHKHLGRPALHLGRERHDDVSILGPHTLGVHVDVRDLAHAGEGLEVLLVDKTVGGGDQPGGGDDGGGALDCGGRLEVKDGHERRPRIALGHNPSDDPVLTSPPAVAPPAEEGENCEIYKSLSSHLNVGTVTVLYCDASLI